ncbi:MAG: Ig-like domain-containing protein [Betaproteobacteria bacterium]
MLTITASPSRRHSYRAPITRAIHAAAIALLAAGLAGGFTPAGAQNAASADVVTVGQPPVAAGEYNGDLSKIPFSTMSVGSPKTYRRLLPGPASSKDPASGTTASPASLPVGPLAPMPPTTQNFPGMSFADACTGGQCGTGFPPDTNGVVGPNHYIQQVNGAVAIYNKTGTLLTSFTEDTLWTGVGTSPCNGNSQGDPITLYDWLADRWVLTWFAFGVSGGNPVSPFYQCIAASKTADPVAGGWWLYAVQMDPGTPGTPPVGNLNDYFKLGAWQDCIYLAANEFLFPAGSYSGSAFASFSRADMYSGAPMTYALGFIPFTNSGTSADDAFTMIPSNNNGKGANAVQSGTPNYFVSESIYVYAFMVRKFTAGPNCGGGGTLGAPTSVSQNSYDFNLPGIPQPNTANTLDNLGDRLMQMTQYRKVAGVESLWVTHNVQVTADPNVAMQWAQIDVTGGTVAATPVQQGFHKPDTTLFRWMGSIAADKDGNVALGYSTSNGTAPNFPSIAYAGRLATDPLNTLPQTEVTMIAGGGSQTNNCGGGPCDRWGDYSAMTVDPADDCTFWYTNEYYDTQVNGTAGNWHTRIGSFKYPSCVSAAATTTTLASSLNPSTVGASVTFTATVTGVLPTGPVDFRDGGVTIPTCGAQPLGGGGNTPTATCTTTGLTAGSHNIDAVYAGDGGNSTSTSAPLTQVVNAPGGSLACTPNPALSLQLVTCTLTLTGNAPTGYVNFKDAGVTLPGCAGKPLTGVGNTKTATCSTSTLSIGTHPITAYYGGDRANPGGTSNTVNEVVNPLPATTTTIVSSLNPSNAGQSVTFTATVTGALPTGTVNFKDGAASIPTCSARPLVGGGNTPTATCSTSTLSVTTHSITGNYSGDTANAPSSSAPLSQVVNTACIPGRTC